jgi:hypothetical protein
MRLPGMLLGALAVLLSVAGQAQDWPYSLYTDSDRTCAARMCNKWWPDQGDAARCLDVYSKMVSEQLANPYKTAAVSPQNRSCIGGESEPCIDPEAVAIGRLLGIYAALSEGRAKVEMFSGRPPGGELTVRWERLSWCHQHYRPDLGTSSYLDVLNCLHPRGWRGPELPDHPDSCWYCRVPAEPLFAGSWVRGHCPERGPYPPE